jgi:multidrug efflux pump subunit AcrA (membrane-fusion protein)
MKLTVRRRLVVPTAVAVAVAGGGAALVARHGASSSTQYRTAVATLGTVTQTISLSGNLAPVGETDLDFGSSGRVTAVDVHPGQAVTAGQPLATIDPAALQAALTQAQATLASAQARLSLDQAGPSAQSLAQSQAAVRTAQTQLQGAQTALADTQLLDQSSIGAAQSALTAAQAKLSADQANRCPSVPTASPSASPSPGGCATPQQIGADTAAATAARDGVSSAQARAQQSEHQAQSQLSAGQVQLQNAQASLTALQQGTTTQQVQIDQSQVQIDQISVDNAQRALTQATLTAPVDGVVGQVNVSVGQIAPGGSSSSGSSSGQGGGSSASSSGTSSSSSSSSSTTHSIVILTPGAFQVVGSVSDAQVNHIAAGQRARITVAGATQSITGTVTGIAPEATVTSGVATFPVTVMLDGSNPSLHAGVSASIAVVVNQVVHVLTVPSSAIRPSGGGADSVQTLVDGQPQSLPVAIGASDALRTQVVSGLNEGDTVVIATVTSAVPTPNASTLLGGGRGGGRGTGGAGRALGG